MVAKESVRARMEDREAGISYTEFSYMLLQAFDFYVLCRDYDCELQIGGSDLRLLWNHGEEEVLCVCCYPVDLPLVAASCGFLKA
jgi:tyrosyl-tRNA synthetase